MCNVQMKGATVVTFCWGSDTKWTTEWMRIWKISSTTKVPHCYSLLRESEIGKCWNRMHNLKKELNKILSMQNCQNPHNSMFCNAKKKKKKLRIWKKRRPLFKCSIGVCFLALRLGTRRQSSTEASESAPPIFRNALHVAIQHDSLEVLTLLLKYGVGKYIEYSPCCWSTEWVSTWSTRGTQCLAFTFCLQCWKRSKLLLLRKKHIYQHVLRG